MSKEDTNSEEKIDWIDRDSTKKLLLRALVIACVISVLAEFIVYKLKPHAPVDWGIGFFAIFGFAASSLLIIISKGVSSVIKKPAEFYDADNEEEDAS